MALVDGNKTYANPVPGGASATLAHTQDSGADGLIVAIVTMSNTSDFTTATYAGESMTMEFNLSSAKLSQRQVIFSLNNPPSGNANFVVNFNGNQWNPVSIVIMSFTGSGGVGSIDANDTTTTPNSQTLTVSENSMIYATGISINSQNADYEINGSARTILFIHNTNRVVGGALSASGLPSGSIDVVTKSDFGDVSNLRFEITEASSPSGVAEGNWLLLM